MKPSVILAETVTPDGSALSLHRHDGHYHLRIGGHGLVSTTATSSEARLADLACERIGRREGPSVLIGGLGLGFTLRRVLDLVHTDAKVQVAELLPEVVAWNRDHLRSVNGDLVDDARVEILIDDVFAVLTRAGAACYDAVILDVDNGPAALVDPGNARLYAADGLRILSRTLRPGGRAVFWSAAPDGAFMARLAAAGFGARAVRSKAYAQARRGTRTLIVADWPG